MYEYIKGEIAQLTPTYVVIETGGVGYLLHISLFTYGKLMQMSSARIFLHQIVREDAHLLFGFFDEQERDLFRLLITVSGIGANTARMMLSSLHPDEIRNAVLSGNVAVLNGVKGIGSKTAQRIIVDLRDKIGKVKAGSEIFIQESNTVREEALFALVALGFQKNQSEKVLTKLMATDPGLSVELLIKGALKQL
jgi:holliday junction DNA helicase RuvA